MVTTGVASGSVHSLRHRDGRVVVRADTGTGTGMRTDTDCSGEAHHRQHHAVGRHRYTGVQGGLGIRTLRCESIQRLVYPGLLDSTIGIVARSFAFLNST